MRAEQRAKLKPAHVLVVTQAAGGEASPATPNEPTVQVHCPLLAAQSLEVV